ncbi:BatD family protein [Flavobacterium sp.]|uniref:BatD family protein n=1 Tax=Flavobacterium sp. TaxID=239 RepID=UPI0026157B99|nr:BatD family protein [Flavobacterium sp.]
MKKYLLFLFTIVSLNLLSAQTKFEARVSRDEIGINENVRIEFYMNFDGDNLEIPNFQASGFRVISGPSQMVSQSWVNGRSSFNKAYSYTLMPLKKGKLVIKNATIEFNGQVYKTQPVTITVGNAVAQQQQQNPYANNPYYQQQQRRVPVNAGKDGVHLVAEISKTNPYVNEPITVIYKIYVSQRSAVGGWNETDKPKYADFWSQNIDVKNLVIQNGMFKGESYRYAVLRKVVLYPQKAGSLQIEPLTLDVQVEVPTGRVDIFGEYETKTQIKRVSAGAKTINVKPLPEAGKPEGFSGAVGKFDFKVTPSRTSLKSGESLDLDLKVVGTGNLKLFSLPKPVVPSSLEMFDPEHTENVQTPLSGMTGSISDKYTIIPNEKGNFPIKTIQFSYFDLTSNSYKTITSQQIVLNVAQGKENAVAVNPNKEEPTVKKSFAFIKQKTNLESIESDDFLGSGLFYGLLFLPFLLIPVLIIFKKRKDTQDADIIGNKTKRANALAKKYLSEAKKQINNKEPFYIALEKAMHNFLKAKLNIETSEMSKDKITEILLSRNANSETVKEFITLTESCELARYAPSSSTIIHQDYDKAVEIISELEKQIK